MISFSTERMFVRPIEKEDKEIFSRLYTDRAVMQYIAEPFSIESIEDKLSRAVMLTENPESSMTYMIIFCRSSNKALGILGVIGQLKSGKDLEIGIMFSLDLQGKGFATEMLGALTDYLFKHYAPPKITMRYQRLNLAVVKMAQKLQYEDSDTNVENNDMCASIMTYQKWLNLQQK